MKFSARKSIQRKKENKDIKSSKPLISILSELNPGVSFTRWGSSIHTDLDKNRLANIKLPFGAEFDGNPEETCKFGVVFLTYNSSSYMLTNNKI